MTNFSTQTIPLHCYHGNLTCSFVESGCPCSPNMVNAPSCIDNLNFGVVTMNEIHSKSIVLSNPNPVPISLTAINITVEGVGVKLEYLTDSTGVITLEKEKAKAFGYLHKKGKKIKPIVIPHSTVTPDPDTLLMLEPGHKAILTVDVLSKTGEHKQGNISLVTKYETIEIPVEYRSLQGELFLVPQSFQFDPSIPGHVSSFALNARNSYKYVSVCLLIL
jgi:hypothetical protein